MRKNVPTLFIILLIISSDFVSGKGNKTKTPKNSHKSNFLKEKYENERVKRSLIANDDEDRPFWPNRGKKQVNEELVDTKNDNSLNYNQKFAKSNDKSLKDEPFWANRGRRDSKEKNYDDDYGDFIPKYCDGCPKGTFKDRRENIISPFWGSRGRRNSKEIEDVSEPFWGNRGRREENDDPFWGNRGRRTEDEPFWGNRGRRDDEPFWGNRGRREDSEPFWGNRGRRDDSEPFWGNRGRRHENEPFWGNRGRREEAPFWSNRGRRKQDLKDSIMSAITDVENDIDDLSRLKRPSLNFWGNRGRESKMSHMFNEPSRNRVLPIKPIKARQTEEPGSVLDNRMYVDEPNYIIVERMGRSSAEFDDPYYISRGKKYYLSHSLEKAARDRRGAIEEIVKTVRNDPYYIARGKKDTEVRNNNTNRAEEYVKAKELVCAAIDLITTKQNGKVKRQISDNERNRRTTLKKLAAQLQADPYFVSRGKKSDENSDKDNLDQFISNIAEKCN